LIVFAGLAGWAAVSEMRSGHFQAGLFSWLARGMTFAVENGPSRAIEFPKTGPYDERLGYTRLPDFISLLTLNRYAVDAQARWSPRLERLVKLGTFPIYPEKDKAGLRIFSSNGDMIYGVQSPERAYSNFASVPPVLAETLSFIEDRHLFDPGSAERNPAIEWKRLGLAVAGRIGRAVDSQFNQGGGSTLATQIEKFRHSPGGLTGGVGEKMRQMLTASARAYMGGRNTVRRRQEIVTTYLNATPLASMPGYGEVIGVPEALWVWFGIDYNETTKILNAAPRNPAELARKGLVYRQVLSLLLSGRRPSHYLVSNREALIALTNKYLRLLCDAGVINPGLRDAALHSKLTFRTEAPPITAVSQVGQKAIQNVRNKLVSLLKLPDLYSLDRLDLNAKTSIDTAAQARVSEVLQKLSDPAFLRFAGMVGHQLLGDGNPAKITWSFVLYERGGDRNYVRIHADSLNQPFDINSGAKLQLGSTAKLRTLIVYLTIVSELHNRLAALPNRDLLRTAASAEDPLTEWGAGYLARTQDRRLQAMLDAAMQRTYSAAPGTFFTGGGNQSFDNFATWEDDARPTVETAFQHSINLAFVRILRDIANYYTVASGVQIKRLLGDTDDSQREAYLQRFIESDSRRFLHRFYKDYRGLNGNQAMTVLADHTQPIPKRLATVFLSIHPDARLAHLQQFLMTHLPEYDLNDNELWDLYLTYSPERLNLADRGYVAGIHPLELWLAEYLQKHPGASWKEILEASAQVRQEAYSWLFKGSPHKQDTRIRILLEQDAFERIYENWKALGYPFSYLVPSLGTALGASGDRPDALADLMGTILNGGVRVPTVTVEHLRFAANTPYETSLSPSAQPQRVMPPEVAATVRRALMGIVSSGTARRLSGTYIADDGTSLPVGGKTGTGDNRFERFGPGGSLISSRVVDRTATFVFFLGDRFFGTVTAYVPGNDAESFGFTSAIAVQLLKALKPELDPLINKKPAGTPMLVDSSRLKPPAVPIAASEKETAQPASSAPSGPRRNTSKMTQPNTLSPAARLNRQELERLGL
jgi:membrane peptidoglycan carboxypeptidase